MNKQYYNNYLKQIIKELMEEKENYVEEIQEISTYIDFQKDKQDLDRLDLLAINEKRNNIGAIYQLIEDLDKLLNK